MQIESLHDEFYDILHFPVSTRPKDCVYTFKNSFFVSRKRKAFIRINSQRLGTRGYFGKVDFVTFGLLTPLLNKKALILKARFSSMGVLTSTRYCGGFKVL